MRIEVTQRAFFSLLPGQKEIGVDSKALGLLLFDYHHLILSTSMDLTLKIAGACFSAKLYQI